MKHKPETTISVASSPPSDHARELKLDAIDLAIVRVLQKDGRMAYGKLGARVGLSDAAARQRVQRLLARGAMQIAAVTDPVRLGSKSMALVGIKARGDSRRIAKAIAALPESIYVVATAGPYDVIAELVCANHEDLLRVTNERIRSLGEVADAVVLMYLGTYKHTFTYSIS